MAYKYKSACERKWLGNIGPSIFGSQYKKITNVNIGYMGIYRFFSLFAAIYKRFQLTYISLSYLTIRAICAPVKTKLSVQSKV